MAQWNSQAPPHFGGGFSDASILATLTQDILASTSPLRWGFLATGALSYRSKRLAKPSPLRWGSFFALSNPTPWERLASFGDPPLLCQCRHKLLWIHAQLYGPSR